MCVYNCHGLINWNWTIVEMWVFFYSTFTDTHAIIDINRVIIKLQNKSSDFVELDNPPPGPNYTFTHPYKYTLFLINDTVKPL